MNREELFELLNEKVGAEGNKSDFYEFDVDGLSFIKLRDILFDIGEIAYEDRENCVYISKIKGGTFKKNYALVAFQLKETVLKIAINSNEGLIDQKTNEDIIEIVKASISEYILANDKKEESLVMEKSDDSSNDLKLIDSIKKYKGQIIGTILLIILVAIIIFANKKSNTKIDSNINLNVENDIVQTNDKEEVVEGEDEESEDIRLKKYQTAYGQYNNAIEQFNNTVKMYNNLIIKLEDYNISNLPAPLEEKAILDEDYNSFDDSDYEELNKTTEEVINDKNGLLDEYVSLYQQAYNYIIGEYNLISDEYNTLRKISSVDYVEDMPYSIVKKPYINKPTENIDEKELITSIENIQNDLDKRVGQYVVLKQITNPSVMWVKERLKSVNQIEGQREVTSDNDPNGLLGKKNGYTGCVYFNINKIDINSIKGNTIIEKGTDAGGSIEIYSNLDDALNRCDYLSQFDGTLLYSGSYAVIGTMVVRTSYILSSQEQIELTNQITTAFTEIK